MWSSIWCDYQLIINGYLPSIQSSMENHHKSHFFMGKSTLNGGSFRSFLVGLPEGNHQKPGKTMEKPMKNHQKPGKTMNFPSFFVCLPEGITTCADRKSRFHRCPTDEATETRAFSALALLDSALPLGSSLRGWFQAMNISLKGGIFHHFYWVNPCKSTIFIYFRCSTNRLY